MLRVRDCMSPDPVTVTADVNLRRVAQLFREIGSRHLPVVDEEGGLIGIITTTDLVRTMPPFSKVQVEQAMTGDVISIGPDEPVQEAARLMRQHKVGCVPVVDGHRMVVGILTETDIFDAFIDTLEELAEANGADAGGLRG